MCTPGSMNSLFTDQNLVDFWPGFFGLEQTARGGVGKENKFKKSVLEYYRDRRNTVLQYCLLFTIDFPKKPKNMLGTI